MKYLPFLLFMFVINLSAQPQAPNRIDSKGNKQGVWKKYEKDILIYEGTFKDNVPVGEFKYYHANGKLKSITFFVQGVHEVRTTIFHPNEKKASEGVFIDQLKHGEWRYWDQDGTLITVENYKNGKKHGVWKVYSTETGILLEESNYIDDKLHGTAKTFYIDGVPCTVENFINGQRNGIAESYYIDGKLSIQGVFHEGLKIGIWIYNDQNGRVRKEVEYKRSQMIKTFLFFYNGNQQVKLNQDYIAYFIFEPNKTKIKMKKGTTIECTDDAYTIKEWADMITFIPVSPKLHVAHSAIKGFKPQSDGSILVEIVPNLPYPVYSRGDEAMMVKMLFNKELPKLD
jgi:antitoxin component YwqK of YwqJK toxin-antitoxin module